MDAFAAIVSFGRPLETIESEERLVRALTRARKTRVESLRSDGALIVVRRDSGSGQPPSDDGCKTLSVADARLDNRPEVLSWLGLSPDEAARSSDSDVLIRLFARFGGAGLARAVGAFAFAHVDASGQLTLARDCLGQRSLFFHRGDGYVAFATSLATLLALSCVPRALDELAVADFLVLSKGEPRQTLYHGIERVPNRTAVAFTRERTTHRIYWSPDFTARLPYTRADDFVARARELFDQAVAAAIVDTPDVAISLSGGFDSSAIAATVARLGRSASISGYSLVAPQNYTVRIAPNKYVDESDKLAALVAMYPSIRLRTFAPDLPHPQASADRIFARTAMPTYGSANLGFYAHIDAAIAGAGHKVHLIGSAGNFGLTWNGRLWLMELARTGQWGKLIAAIRANERASGGNGFIRSFMRHVVMHMATPRQRDWIYRRIGRKVPSPARFSGIHPDLIAELNLTERWLDQGVDPGFRGMGARAADFRAKRLFDDNQTGGDFLNAYGEMHGFEYRDPHADRRLLEFCLAVPEAMYHDGRERSFARAVLADRLPPEILSETRRGEQGVGWFRHLDAQRDEIAGEIDRIAASPLARRLIDVTRLKALLDDWPKDEQTAVDRREDYRLLMMRGVHVGQFVRWVEGGNA